MTYLKLILSEAKHKILKDSEEWHSGARCEFTEFVVKTGGRCDRNRFHCLSVN
ncbi:hypothetical protein QUB80_28740 [Chlorogloeopsis sp. ULAP01]|uniref:hypothetical protein n=1 Tax=Chlorogloeopsis sp. ULAP01 TaxID=3056483 RepID=UPI0025AB3192|nr:hypothetical protein [Chlorogloeopsis sp. ULAP01]MDM9384657.1 hypothetical protein [Chlorogloeopsis sp. ULAP01]